MLAPADALRTRRHWYMTYVGECPVCGRDASYRKRVYGRPPAKHRRYESLAGRETYDQCVERRGVA